MGLLIKTFFILLNRIISVQECDATGADSSNAAGFQKIQRNKKREHKISIVHIVFLFRTVFDLFSRP